MVLGESIRWNAAGNGVPSDGPSGNTDLCDADTGVVAGAAAVAFDLNLNFLDLGSMTQQLDSDADSLPLK